MSVVGLTLGSGANAIRPSAASAASVATIASTLLDGCVRSYQAKPSPTTRAPGGGGGRGAAGDAGGLGGEVPAAGQHRGRRAVGDRPAVGQQDHAVGDL